MKILSGKQVAPRRVLAYGQHGAGKSTWAAGAPKPMFLNIEDGLADIDCHKTEYLTDYSQVVDSVSWLINNQHDFGSVVLDTADWLHQLIAKRVCQDNKVTSIEKVPYGKGPSFTIPHWEFVLRGLEVLRRQKQMHVILLAHSQIKKFNNPETDAYDRYEPDLYKEAASLLQEWCDEVFFVGFRVFTRSEDQGFNRTRNIAVGGKERFIRTTESPAAPAKNRLQLPEELPLEWAAYEKYFPNASATTQAGNISGIVANGSSKKVEVAHG